MKVKMRMKMEEGVVVDKQQNQWTADDAYKLTWPGAKIINTEQKARISIVSCRISSTGLPPLYVIECSPTTVGRHTRFGIYYRLYRRNPTPAHVVDTRRHTVVFNRFAVQRRIGSDADVAECPKSSGSSVSVRPRWKQGVPYVGIKQRVSGSRHQYK
jgi:hypothetical protein